MYHVGAEMRSVFTRNSALCKSTPYFITLFSSQLTLFPCFPFPLLYKSSIQFFQILSNNYTNSKKYDKILPDVVEQFFLEIYAIIIN